MSLYFCCYCAYTSFCESNGEFFLVMMICHNLQQVSIFRLIVMSSVVTDSLGSDTW